ncbi:MAG: hypothetical protein M3453_15005, partial [Pseudomonadota bacterium]|nr:hypothetical protein [Pseudomonadota bacterium]
PIQLRWTRWSALKGSRFQKHFQGQAVTGMGAKATLRATRSPDQPAEVDRNVRRLSPLPVGLLTERARFLTDGLGHHQPSPKYKEMDDE